MLRPALFRAATALALGAAFLMRPAEAQDKTSSAKLVPRTVYAYFAVPDVETFKERYQGSSLGAMLKDPKLQPAFEQVKEKLGEAGGQVRERLGLSVDELLNVPSGELAVAVFDVPGESVGYVLIVDYGDSGSAVDTLVQKAESALQERGATRSTQDFEGTEIVVYETRQEVGGDDDLDIEGEETPPASGAADSVGWFRKDDRIVLGSSVPALEAILARWDGGHDDTLAANEVFSYVMDKTRSDDRDPVFTWYVDPIGGFQAFATRSQGGPPPLQMATAFLPMLGLTKLKAIGGSVDVASDEFDTISKAFAYVEQPATGVLGVFQFPPAELAPPEWVPSTATMYFGANWDVQTAVSSVKTLVDTFQGPGAFDRIMSQAANNPSTKVHPQKDILDQLTGRMTVVNFPSATPRNAPEDGPPVGQQPTVIAVGVKDEAKMRDLLARVSQTKGFPGEKREFQGSTVYELPTPNPAGGEPNKMAFTVTKGSLVVATDVSRLEEILRSGKAAPLAQSEAYRSIAEHVPGQVSMLSYSDQRDQLKTIYEAFRSGQLGGQVEGFDLSVLPPFDDISKYLRSSGGYALPDPNGALFVSFSLKLEE